MRTVLNNRLNPSLRTAPPFGAFVMCPAFVAAPPPAHAGIAELYRLAWQQAAETVELDRRRRWLQPSHN